MTERISELQLGYLALGFIAGSSLVLSGSAPGPIRWITALVGALEGLLVASIYVLLAERFQRKGFVQISLTVFGPWLGLLPSLLFFLFTLQLGGLVLENFGDYFNIAVMQQSPLAFFIIPLAIACIYAVRSGIEVLARVAVLLVPITLLVITSLTLFLIPQYRLSNLLPIFPVGIGELLRGAHGFAMFPFAETVAFMMVLPALSSRRSSARPLFTAMLAGGVLLAAITLRNAAALGVVLGEEVYPSHAAARLIRVEDVFTRLEILVAANFLTMGFLKISVLLYSASLSLAQILRTNSHKTLVIPVCIMMVVLALTGFSHGFAENADFAQNTWPIYAPVFTILLPTIVLLVAVIRRIPKRNAP